jgi:hypothetical protein
MYLAWVDQQTGGMVVVEIELDGRGGRFSIKSWKRWTKGR